MSEHTDNKITKERTYGNEKGRAESLQNIGINGRSNAQSGIDCLGASAGADDRGSWSDGADHGRVPLLERKLPKPLIDHSELIFRAQDHVYLLDDAALPSVTQILAPITDRSGYSASARDFGTTVHRICEEDANGTLNEKKVPDVFKPRLQAYREFMDESKFERLGVEHRCYHQAFGFAGTMDLIGRLGDYWAVIDIKSGAPVPAYKIQLAAYSMMLFDSHAIDPKRFTLRLSNKGYQLTEHPTPELWNDINIFRNLLPIFWWRQKEGVRGF